MSVLPRKLKLNLPQGVEGEFEIEIGSGYQLSGTNEAVNFDYPVRLLLSASNRTDRSFRLVDADDAIVDVLVPHSTIENQVRWWTVDSESDVMFITMPLRLVLLDQPGPPPQQFFPKAAVAADGDVAMKCVECGKWFSHQGQRLFACPHCNVPYRDLTLIRESERPPAELPRVIQLEEKKEE